MPSWPLSPTAGAHAARRRTRSPGATARIDHGLTRAADAAVKAPRGRTVTLTVGGTPTALTPGATYAGALTLTVA
ncbi:hypothetical protein ACFWDQ_27605 [Streptomyces sp. NPDC060053]|uniref:hypothetical protein n=1 Tax=Streptomyces sp. NPDC060053 TaxID=3347047 RepID=UPI00369E401A